MGANFVNWSLANRQGDELVVADGMTYASDFRRLESPDQVRVMEANLLEPAKYRHLVEWSDIVVNFAAETHNDNSLDDPKIFLKTNVEGLFELLQVCVILNKPIIQVSTDEVYGDFPIESSDVATELSPYKPSSPYSSSKAAGDLMAMAWARSFGLDVIVTHCTNNFGPGQHREKFIPNIIEKVTKGLAIEIYGTGTNIRDWIHVDDHSSALWKIIDEGTWGEIYNISAYNYVSNIELVSLVTRALGKASHPVVFVKDRPGHDLRYGLDSSKLRQLGWAPVHNDFEAAISQLVN